MAHQSFDPSVAGLCQGILFVVGCLSLLPGFCGETLKEVLPPNDVLFPNDVLDTWSEALEDNRLLVAPSCEAVQDGC